MALGRSGGSKIIEVGSDQIKEHLIGCTVKFGFYPRCI